MKILMLAPEPFFQPRGTPISIYFRLKALSDLGHRVDLITYHLGEDKKFKNLRIFRIPNLFLIRKIKIGPSLAKIPLDFLLVAKAAWRLLTEPYDLIFSHEEGALFGILLAKAWRIPHLYDMHSSLPQQLNNFNFSQSRFLKKLFVSMERLILKNSRAVIVICLDLQKRVQEEGFGQKSVLLENFLDFSHKELSAEDIRNEKKKLGLERKQIVLYTGNFQPYQGISLLLEAAAKIKDEDVEFLLVGENKAAVNRMRQKARAWKILEKVRFTGQVPPSEVLRYIALSNVLVSPRLSGTNTPLKIYSFLKSGKPLVATNLWTHTQILDDRISVLVNPDAESLAEGISFALNDPDAQRRAQSAREFAEREYTYSKYLEKISLSLEKLRQMAE